MAERDDGTAGITQLLIAWSGGHREALDNLVPLVYKDLRRLAAGYMKGEPVGHSLQPTALVHEAYVRLIDQRRVQWRDRAHFFGVAAGIMRRILVDQARVRRADKRGGGWERVTLVGDDVAGAASVEIDVLALHDSLERLAAVDSRQRGCEGISRSTPDEACRLAVPDNGGQSGSRISVIQMLPVIPP